MKITDVQEVKVPLEETHRISNAIINFAQHTTSLVAVYSDAIRNGRPVIGYAFNAMGRFAQGEILRDRMIPRVLSAQPESLLRQDGAEFDPAKVLQAAMRQEKPGGHGDRASAAGALELAIWDLNSKLRDEPAYVNIARAHGRTLTSRTTATYATGGFYWTPGDPMGISLTDELQRYRDKGYTAFKIKIGGVPIAADIRRLEEALAVAGSPDRLAVDVNCRFDMETGAPWIDALAPYRLRWLEEFGDPLDYDVNARMVARYGERVATGENLFSAVDVKNLIQFGGMRSGKDIFQMEPALCYGLTEYARMIDIMEAAGFSRKQAYPHGGHALNMHVAVGLQLGGTESLPFDGMFQPFMGFASDCLVHDGVVEAGESPGFGLESKPELRPWLKQFETRR